VSDCTPGLGLGNGVTINFIDRRGVSVRNGAIVGMGSNGVWVGEQGEVSNVRARWNRLDGIKADVGSIVAGSVAFENGDNGIEVGTGSTVFGNTATLNGGDGIATVFSATVSGNTAIRNGGDGINVGSGSTVSGNTVYENKGTGIKASSGSNVQGISSTNCVGPTPRQLDARVTDARPLSASGLRRRFAVGQHALGQRDHPADVAEACGYDESIALLR
jgi:parallel beta-helix repeat protein